MKSAKIFLSSVAFIVGFNAVAQKVPDIEKKTYIAPDGKMYVQKALPIYLYLSTKPNESNDAKMLKSERSQKYSNPMYFDSEGMNTIRSPWAVDQTTKELKYPKEEIIYEVYADSKAPVTTIDMGEAKKLAKNGKLYVNGSVQITFKANDALAGVDKIMISVNQADYSPFTVPLTFDEEKEYVVKYFSFDNVGNAEEVKTITFIIDKSSPQSALDIKGDYSENIISGKALLVISAKDNYSGLSRLIVKIDNGKESAYTGPISTVYLEQGDHTLTYYASDNLGNTEQAHSFEFYVDKTPPTILPEIIGKSFMINGKDFSSGRSQLKITTLDNKAGIKEVYYSINNSEFKLYEKPVILSSISGSMKIKAYAVDKVNNRSETNDESTETKAPYIDLSGPVLKYNFIGPVFINSDTIFISNKTKIQLKGIYNEAGLNKITYNIDDKEEIDFTSSFSITNEGLHNLEFTGYDNVENSNTSSFTVVVDNSGPSLYPRFSTAPKGAESSNGKNTIIYPSHVGLFIAATDTICGYERMTYSLNGSKEKPFTGFINGFGKKNLVIVKAYDKLGNENKTNIEFDIKN